MNETYIEDIIDEAGNDWRAALKRELAETLTDLLRLDKELWAVKQKRNALHSYYENVLGELDPRTQKAAESS